MDIVTILTNPPKPSSTPTVAAGDDTRNAILQLGNILHRNELPPSKLDPILIRTIAAAGNLQKKPISAKQTTSFSTSHGISTTTPVSPSTQHVNTSALLKINHEQQRQSTPSRLGAPQGTQSSVRHRATQALIAQLIVSLTMNHIYDDLG